MLHVVTTAHADVIKGCLSKKRSLQESSSPYQVVGEVKAHQADDG